MNFRMLNDRNKTQKNMVKLKKQAKPFKKENGFGKGLENCLYYLFNF
jgi:hypothetical protein